MLTMWWSGGLFYRQCRAVYGAGDMSKCILVQAPTGYGSSSSPLQTLHVSNTFSSTLSKALSFKQSFNLSKTLLSSLLQALVQVSSSYSFFQALF